MKGTLEYTIRAHRYTGRFPMLTYLGTQINFWVIANLILVIILHLASLVISHTFKIEVAVSFSSMAIIGFIFGIVHGLPLGFVGYYLDRNVSLNYSLGKIILLKALTSLVVLLIIQASLKYFLFELLISSSLEDRGVIFDNYAFAISFLMLGVYYFFMALVISFINQTNKKYGPGIVVPLLLGYYRKPREEERIFMFMDLKSSTATAERLGHLKYSSFIRDCFFDINRILYEYNAQVYQYVGDEIVLTWPEKEGLRDHSCIRFFFACKEQFAMRSEYYLDQYGFLPDFKAGLHAGIVSAVEIGDVKRDIAYHGDTLNTAARIQSVCNHYDKSFLISEYLFDKVKDQLNMKVENLGQIALKGKISKVGVISIDELSGHRIQTR